MRQCLLMLILIFGVNEGKGQLRRLLQINDEAPPLHIIEWLTGSPVAEFTANGLYVVEFSGSWCPPCRKAIPHLNYVSQKFSDSVKVISIYLENNNRENTTDINYIMNVRSLVEALDYEIKFTIGVDNPQQMTKQLWNISAIPRAYVLRGKRILWIGNPNELSPILTQITQGVFDPESTVRAQQQFSSVIGDIRELKLSGNYGLAVRKIDSLIKIFPDKRSSLSYQKFGLLVGDDDKGAYAWLQEILDDSVEGFDWPHFIGIELRKISPENQEFDIELRALDRGIQESETKFYAAPLLWIKANTYAKMRDYLRAAECCKQAIEGVKVTDNSSKLTDYERSLFIYEYKIMENSDAKMANLWLRQQVAKDNVKPSLQLIINVMESTLPDYDLVLNLIDLALTSEANLRTRTALLGQKSEAFVKKGDYKNAEKYCQMALDESRNYGDQSHIKRYELKLNEIKQQYPGDKD